MFYTLFHFTFLPCTYVATTNSLPCTYNSLPCMHSFENTAFLLKLNWGPVIRKAFNPLSTVCLVIRQFSYMNSTLSSCWISYLKGLAEVLSGRLSFFDDVLNVERANVNNISVKQQRIWHYKRQNVFQFSNCKPHSYNRIRFRNELIPALTPTRT
jgi:hypothetical protein